MKKTCYLLAASVLLPSLTQALGPVSATLDDISSGQDFEGTTFSAGSNGPYTADAWGSSSNFNGADFSGLTIDVGDGGPDANQPFYQSTIQGADFSGATFNWTPYASGGNIRVNFFRQDSTGIDAYAGADFSDTTWNIHIDDNMTGIGGGGQDDFFNGGSGSTSAANAANALDLSGADFNFTLGTGAADLSSNIAALLIVNLGETALNEGNGAFYDTEFVDNNWAAFGYGSAVLLETDLTANGWQAVPESSSYALLSGCLALGYVMIRRRS